MEGWRTKDYLKVADLKSILNISHGAAYNLMHELPHVQVGNTYRVSRQAFEKWLRDQERKSS